MFKTSFRRLFVFLALCGILFGSVVLLSPKLYEVGGKKAIPESQARILGELGAEAARNLDVPIAALLLVDDHVVGKGFNTVERDTNPSGHAEINAIADALKKLGKDGFERIDRGTIKLVTTLEPCPMCRAAITQQGIRSVMFLKARSLKHWSLELARQLRYEWGKTKGTNEALQDSLFRLHPHFDPKKMDL